jgi:hypothetical protein
MYPDYAGSSTPVADDSQHVASSGQDSLKDELALSKGQLLKVGSLRSLRYSVQLLAFQCLT